MYLCLGGNIVIRYNIAVYLLFNFIVTKDVYIHNFLMDSPEMYQQPVLSLVK